MKRTLTQRMDVVEKEVHEIRERIMHSTRQNKNIEAKLASIETKVAHTGEWIQKAEERKTQQQATQLRRYKRTTLICGGLLLLFAAAEFVRYFSAHDPVDVAQQVINKKLDRVGAPPLPERP